jgi:hypothetical protein
MVVKRKLPSHHKNLDINQGEIKPETAQRPTNL